MDDQRSAMAASTASPRPDLWADASPTAWARPGSAGASSESGGVAAMAASIIAGGSAPTMARLMAAATAWAA